MLLFVFLYSGTVRSYVVTDFSALPVKKSIQAHKNTQVAQKQDHLIVFNAFNQFENNDSESDDLHHDFISFESDDIVDFFHTNHTLSWQFQFAKTFNIPLYDLYCKWKFHLS
jgi:hypothetical protein